MEENIAEVLKKLDHQNELLEKLIELLTQLVGVNKSSDLRLANLCMLTCHHY